MLDLDSLGQGPLEGRLFAEAIGSFLLEVDAGTDPALLLEGLEYRVIGNVAPDPGIEIRAGGNTARVSLAELEEVWSAPFREVVG